MTNEKSIFDYEEEPLNMTPEKLAEIKARTAAYEAGQQVIKNGQNNTIAYADNAKDAEAKIAELEANGYEAAGLWYQAKTW